MIIIKLSGGLGNQMFQYALGKHLAIKNNTKLKLDLQFYNSQDLRRYELDVFNITDPPASENDIAAFILPENASPVRKVRHYLHKKAYGSNIVPEKHFSFDPTVLETGPDAYVDGYWQSEKYFTGIAQEIRSCFQFKDHIRKENESLRRQICTKNSVSIHIRRGDYVSSEHTNSIHGVCDLRYYREAILLIAGKIPDPFFYVFSDDIEWTRQNLQIGYEHQFVDNADDAGNDLYLMSRCKHNIIANSSFSWWGAWLNENDQKIIIAPDQWFRDRSKNTADLIPAAWIRL